MLLPRKPAKGYVDKQLLCRRGRGDSLDCVKERYPEVYPNWRNFRFPGRGQRETPIADVRGIVEIVMLLPGRHAARIRRQAAELRCRYLGGGLANQSVGWAGNVFESVCFRNKTNTILADDLELCWAPNGLNTQKHNEACSNQRARLATCGTALVARGGTKLVPLQFQRSRQARET